MKNKRKITKNALTYLNYQFIQRLKTLFILFKLTTLFLFNIAVRVI